MGQIFEFSELQVLSEATSFTYVLQKKSEKFMKFLESMCRILFLIKLLMYSLQLNFTGDCGTGAFM